jgi:hypothetical protein
VLKAGDTMTGVLAVTAGTAALPAITPSGDPNTGIFSPGADQLAISTNGVQRINIEADGDINIDSGGVFYDATNNRLAIGTTSPPNRFTTDITAPTSSYDGINLVRGGSATGFGLFFAGSSYSYGTGLASGDAWLYSSTQPISIMADGASSTIKFSTGGNTERARIDSSGTLTVKGQGTAGVNAAVSFNGSAPVNSLIVDSSGRLLVGTSTSPSGSFGQFSRLVIQGYIGDDTGDGAMSIQRGKAATNIVAGDGLGRISFNDNAGNTFASISAAADANAGSGDYPGRLVFSTTADGASSPTERMRINSAGVLQVADAGNISVGTTTGTKIGTATTQKLGFYNATPVVQPTAVANATDAATAISQLNALLAHMRTLGLIAT